MWTLVIRKILHNKWMMLCLLAGFVIVVAMVSSIPIYTDGIMQRMLTQDLEDYQKDSSQYPGSYTVSLNLLYASEVGEKANTYEYFRKSIADEMLPSLDLPFTAQAQLLSAENMMVEPADGTPASDDKTYFKMQTLSDFADHISLVGGRVMNPGVGEDGVYEVMASEKALKELKLSLNVVYNGRYILDKTPLLKFRIVGVYTVKDPSDPYWFNGLGTYDDCLLMDFDTYKGLFVAQDSARLVSKAVWYYAIDYHSITIDRLPSLMAELSRHQTFYAKYRNPITFKMPAYNILQDYQSRASQLKTTLWIILVPMFVMLSFYIFMVSQLIVANEENEIAVMRSRGASSLQIFLVYLLEGVVLGALSLLIGPPVGFLLCRILGASNGFLEFVQRAALPLSFNREAYLYSAAAVCLFLLTMLIPAYIASRTTIVERKRKKGRSTKKPFWKKSFLDVITLAVAIYGRSQYDRLNNLIIKTGESGTDLQLDPLLFLISSLFILGAGMLFLRLYPYLIRFIFFLGKRFWSPELYASFIQVGRSSGQEQFLMLFIILSIAIGIFNANSARTVNQNMEDKISYGIGADVAMDVYWQSDTGGGSQDEAAPGGASNSGLEKEEVTYTEYPYSTFSKIEGVEHTARVLIHSNALARSSKSNQSSGKTMVMGIDPIDFAKTAWFRDDLLPYHWYNYLNLIADAPKAALVSSSLRDKLQLEVGDPIEVSWGSQDSVECTVYAFVDYWPTYNPYAQQSAYGATQDLVVANLSYLQAKMAKEPYQVWLKKKPGVSDAEINAQIEKLSIPLNGLSYAGQETVKAKNDPLLQGLNGMLTLSFIITMLISAIGFLIYWVLSIRSRALQFGIFRAMGLSLKSVLGMILCEQLLISVVAIVVGVVLGGVTSDLFVPMMQMVYSAAEQVPPFIICAKRSDYYKIYAMIAAMITLGVAALGRIISRIKIDQALKLGED